MPAKQTMAAKTNKDISTNNNGNGRKFNHDSIANNSAIMMAAKPTTKLAKSMTTPEPTKVTGTAAKTAITVAEKTAMVAAVKTILMVAAKTTRKTNKANSSRVHMWYQCPY